MRGPLQFWFKKHCNKLFGLVSAESPTLRRKPEQLLSTAQAEAVSMRLLLGCPSLSLMEYDTSHSTSRGLRYICCTVCLSRPSFAVPSLVCTRTCLMSGYHGTPIGTFFTILCRVDKTGAHAIIVLGWRLVRCSSTMLTHHVSQWRLWVA
jgi:hypothetical protein